MEEENDKYLRSSQNSESFDYLSRAFAVIAQPPTPIEPDVHAAALRNETRCYSVSPLFSPHECRQLLRKVFENNESRLNSFHIRNLSAPRKDFQEQKAYTSASDRLKGQPTALTAVNPQKILIESDQDEIQSGNSFGVRKDPSPHPGNPPFKEEQSYFCNVRTDNFRDGQASFTQLFLGGVQVVFLIRKNLGWCAGQKSICFCVKITTCPLLVIWQRKFIASASNGEERNITETFQSLFSKDEHSLDWSIMYSSKEHPGKKCQCSQ